MQTVTKKFYIILLNISQLLINLDENFVMRKGHRYNGNIIIIIHNPGLEGILSVKGVTLIINANFITNVGFVIE